MGLVESFQRASRFVTYIIMVLLTHVLIFYKIPQLDMYFNTQQLHGIHAQHIKNEWQCQQHLGENGRPRACYITPNGIHIGLNIRHLASWAAAMVCHFLPSLTLCSLRSEEHTSELQSHL